MSPIKKRFNYEEGPGLYIGVVKNTFSGPRFGPSNHIHTTVNMPGLVWGGLEGSRSRGQNRANDRHPSAM